MLSKLRISNFALIEEVDLDLPPKLSFLTGETGAGKSILIDAITRLLGDRATQDDVRAGAARALLEAEFEFDSVPGPILQLLNEWQIDIDSNSLILRREIHASGKSRALVNNCAVTLQQLKRLAPLLIDIFGQNEHQSLLDSDSQQKFYDHWIGTEVDVLKLRALCSEIRKIQSQWKSLREREQQRQRDIDMLRFQIQEIEQAGVSENEEQEMIAKRGLLQNRERIHMLCDEILQQALEGDTNLLAGVERIKKNVSELEKFEPDLSSFALKLGDLRETLSDMVRRIDDLRSSLEFEEGSLDDLENRLDLYSRIKRKYGPTVADVLNHLDGSRSELDRNLHAEERSEELLRAVDLLSRQYQELALRVRDQRQSAQDSFERRVEEQLQEVAMGNCRFHVVLNETSKESSSLMETTFSECGLENVVFEIEPNPGEGFRELARIASGGELSRIMLALKSLSSDEGGHCYIFDEIDAGIGGRIAFQIGEKLKRLSSHSQVLCVTHLPQVAAFGDAHFRVAKHNKGDRTITVVEPLEKESRINELARMLSGSEVTETALQHARELRGQVETGAR